MTAKRLHPVLLCAAAFAFAAAPSIGVASEGVAVSLKTSDLNLASPAGRTELDRRIGRAARDACPAATGTRVASGQCIVQVRDQLRARFGEAARATSGDAL